MNHPIFPYIYYSTCSRLSSAGKNGKFRRISFYLFFWIARTWSKCFDQSISNSVLISQIFAKTTTGFRLADFSHLSIAHKFEAGSVSEFGCTTFPADMVFAMSLWVWNGATAHSYKTIQHTHGHACGWCGGVFHTPLLRHLKIAVSTSYLWLKICHSHHFIWHWNKIVSFPHKKYRWVGISFNLRFAWWSGLAKCFTDSTTICSNSHETGLQWVEPKI